MLIIEFQLLLASRSPLAGLPRLKELHLSNASLTEGSLPAVAACPHLANVALVNVGIGDVPESEWHALGTLTALSRFRITGRFTQTQASLVTDIDLLTANLQVAPW